MEKEILDEAVRRLINKHLDEYVKIKYECQREFDKHGGFLR